MNIPDTMPPTSCGSATWGRSPTATRSPCRSDVRERRQARRAARHAAAARAPARLHARAPRGAPTSCRSREDFYRAQGIEVVDDRPRRARHLPRARPAGRLSDHAPSRRRRATCARWKPRSSQRSRATARGALALCGEGPTTPACGSQERKIASIGVHVSRGVTTHGFAVNVDNDLEPFSLGRRLRPAGRGDDLDRRERWAHGARPRFRRAHGRRFCAAYHVAAALVRRSSSARAPSRGSPRGPARVRRAPASAAA